MDKKYVEEHEIEIKYLRNQLAPAEAEEFEVYLMENPDVIERLELDSVISNASSVLQKIDNPYVNSSPVKNALRAQWLNTRQIFMGVTMSLAGALVAFGLLQNSNESLSEIRFVDSQRGSGSGEVVYKLPGDAFQFWSRKKIVLVLETGDFSQSVYNVAVSKESGNEARAVVKGFSIKPDANGRVALVFKANKFPPGNFKVTLNSDEFGTEEFAFSTTILSDDK